MNVKFKAINKKNVLEDTLNNVNFIINTDVEQFAPIPMGRSQ